MVHPATTTAFRSLLFNAVLVPVALMLIIGALLVWQIKRLEYASSWVEHSDLVISQANELQKLTLDLETGLRGYLLTGDEAFLQPYSNALAIIGPQASELRLETLDNPDRHEQLNRIDSMRANWLQYAARQIERRKRGEEYADAAHTGEGKAMMDESRSEFKRLIRSEETLRNVRSSDARRISTLSLWFAGAAALLVGGVFAFLSRSQFLSLAATFDTALRTANDLNLTLENRVEERTGELERRSFQLSEANRELEAFGYSISHDLRAPMRHISGFIDLIRKSGAQFDSTTDELLTTVATTARLAGRMVDDLLSFSRVGRASFSLTPVELNPIIDQCRKDVELDSVGRNVEWVVASLPPVQGDAGLLKMALQNLISNAVKYTGHTDMARIEIGLCNETAAPNESPQVAGPKMQGFFISDNGIGFDMQYSQKLFGVFQRLHRAEEFEGTGIGLANVRRIILRHGGRIWARSQLGRGTTFYFTLPSAQVNS